MKTDWKKGARPRAEEEAPITEEKAAEAQAEPETEAEPTQQQWREALELAVQQRDEAVQKRDEYLDSYRRAQADFQNFKRRNQTARSDGYNDGICEVLEALLPALDNMDRALANAPADDPMAKGVQMTMDALLRSMERFGLEEIRAEGEDFDPELHNAVLSEPGDTPGKVLEVLQKGWRVKEKIIRHPMVKVCQ